MILSYRTSDLLHHFKDKNRPPDARFKITFHLSSQGFLVIHDIEQMEKRIYLNWDWRKAIGDRIENLRVFREHSRSSGALPNIGVAVIVVGQISRSLDPGLFILVEGSLETHPGENISFEVTLKR